MNVYKVYRTDPVRYDEYDGAVIVAESGERAREIAREEIPDFWNKEVVLAELVDTSIEAVILTSFRAG